MSHIRREESIDQEKNRGKVFFLWEEFSSHEKNFTSQEKKFPNLGIFWRKTEKKEERSESSQLWVNDVRRREKRRIGLHRTCED